MVHALLVQPAGLTDSVLLMARICSSLYPLQLQTCTCLPTDLVGLCDMLMLTGC